MPDLDDIDRDQILAGLYLLARLRDGAIAADPAIAEAANALADYRQRLSVCDIEQLFDDLNRFQLPIRPCNRVLCTSEDQ